MWVRSLDWEDPLEEGMATHSSIHAWRIPWTEEPGGLSSIGSQADEPTGNLDPARSLEIMTLLKEINNLGTTMLVVTHEMGLVEQFPNRLIVINEGLIVSDKMNG